jgi:serine/threonine-protein kinase HipA
LESISLKTENDIITEEIKWIRMLANPGSSLGGARPKANVVDEKGDLYIAKFPSKEDSDDKGLWEYVTYQLAIDAGINMSPSGIEKLSSYHTFLTKRFDRVENRKRIHVASAMTMLGYYDGYSKNVSYLEIADFLTRHSVNPHKDLQELFRRIAFNICVSNCDDHLRNHSFIFDKKGISLSPAYDINPDEIGHGLSLNISLHDNSLDLEILMDTHEYYALQKDEALQIIEQVKGAVSGFDVVAKKTGLSKTEIDKKAVAFKQAMR